MMNYPQPFDPATLPEEPLQLIEASAGTGKTYSITSLYLRLLLERELPVEKILVLSFTEAATAELHERLRNRLCAALIAFRRGGESADDFLVQLVRRSSDPARRQLLLQKALSEIDQAAVLTIHGFCRRILQQGAFESGLAFELELLAELDDFFRELVHDFLTTVFHRDDSRLLTLLRQEGWAYWEQWARLALGHRLAPLSGEVGEDELRRCLDAALAAFTEARQGWRADQAAIEQELQNGAFNKPVADYLDAGLAQRLAAYLAPTAPDSLVVPPGSSELTPANFADPAAGVCNKMAIKKGQIPRHPFFSAWASYLNTLAELAAVYRRHLLGQLLNTARRQLPVRLYAAGYQSFDDLLYNLAAALKGEGGQRLAAFIAGRYPVALIDEFQDTDPIQYLIFKTIYGRGRSGPGPEAAPDPAARRLLLIGDPKQAIYAFRGADIFAYLEAAREAGPQRYSMNVNWRADRGMVAALNALFAGVEQPFVVPEIAFQPVAPRPDAADLWQGGEHGGRAPLQFLTLDPEDVASLPAARGAKVPGRSNLEKLIPELLAADLVRLLQGGAKIGQAGAEEQPRPLQPGDIAVLVRSNRQAEEMQAALRRLGVKAVVRSRSGVLAGREAGQLLMLLRGLLDQAGEEERRGAIISELLGGSPAELRELNDDEKKWQEWLSRFSRWRGLWRERGLMAMMRAIGEERQLTARLLSLPDGERRLTNYRHLYELLQRREQEQHLRATVLIKWLEQNRADPRSDGAGEEQELRLESDEAAVQVLTIHRAKGLEFPVVYCPYLWKTWRPDRKKPRHDEVLLYHEPAAGGRGRLALLPDEQCRDQRQNEQLAEEMRLLYVALTRAKHCCLVIWEAATGYQDSALARLLFGEEQLAGLAELTREEMLAMLAERVAEQAHWQLRRLPRRGQVAAWRDPAAALAQVEPVFRTLKRDIGPAWRMGSFSQLAAGAPEFRDPGEGRDYDAAAGPPLAGAGSLLAAGNLSAGDYLPATQPAAPPAERPVVGESAGIVAQLDGPDVRPAAGAYGEPVDGSVKGPVGEVIGGGGGGPIGGDDAEPPPELAGRLAGRIPLADFPAGLAAGNLLHRILELAAFDEPAGLPKLIEPQLAAFGFARQGLPVTLELALKAMLATPLSAAESFCLGEIANRQRLNEMAFTFPVCQDGRPLEPAGLAAVFADHPGPWPATYPRRLAALSFSGLQGFMKGFVDLIFRRGDKWYLADYKSNLLGATYADYRPQRLLEPMVEHHYLLQYHLYCVALHRYLQMRLPDYDYRCHFGGVFYLFLRGMAPELGPAAGIYFDCPAPALIEELSRRLAGSVHPVKSTG